MQRSSLVRNAGYVWFAATMLVLFEAFRQAILLVPTEATMGNVQRIFYWHVPNASLGLIFPYVNLVGSLAFLYYRRRDPGRALWSDALAVASAEVALLFASIGLITGILWAGPVWGVWWAWDERLTLYLLLWLLYASYLLLRRFSASGQAATLAAVISVFAAVDVPIVYMSIRWWRTQHPAPVFGGGPQSGLDKSFYPAVYWSVAGWLMWGVFLAVLRFRLERRRQAAEQDAALRTLEASLELQQ